MRDDKFCDVPIHDKLRLKPSKLNTCPSVQPGLGKELGSGLRLLEYIAGRHQFHASINFRSHHLLLFYSLERALFLYRSLLLRLRSAAP